MLGNNLTCMATISTTQVEFLKFIDGSGSKNEIFQSFFPSLLENMKKKYPDK